MRNQLDVCRCRLGRVAETKLEKDVNGKAIKVGASALTLLKRVIKSRLLDVLRLSPLTAIPQESVVGAACAL